ncbi:phage replisome organizer N-terminal domain-containing protein [Tissierella praeacuta]|uniref:phage replisome organizer N-terminal domain-containing protein n=1 Tax=Tissierella praeacuta TaxID=43131 RepID=UPI003DA3A194
MAFKEGDKVAEVKWIKITTNMFEDEKIDYIESLPEADSILVIWIKLLTMAGKCNSNGFIFLTEQIPYSEDMLAHKFKKPINTVKLALSMLEKLQMIQIDNEGFIAITNWEKHQNIEGLEKIREQNRIRQARYREKQKALTGNVTDNDTDNVIVTDCNGIEQEQELEEELELDIDKEQEQKEGSCSFKDDNFSKISITFQQNGFGTMSLTVKEMLMTLLDDYSAEWIIEAIKIAVKNNKRNLKYVEGILQNWRNQGGMKLETDKKTSTPPIKKTRFHMREQRTDNYSNEELESVMERKRREARERMKGGRKDGD